MSAHVSIFAQEMTVKIEYGGNGYQWLRINAPEVELVIFADDEQLRQIRDAIDAHLVVMEKAEAASCDEAAPIGA